MQVYLASVSYTHLRRQTYFKLYSKSHDEGTLKQYYDECQLFDSQLRGLDEKIQNDRKCKMMYRIVGQVAEYRREMAESYICLLYTSRRARRFCGIRVMDAIHMPQAET